MSNALSEMQHGKCCFCESKILHVSFGDVEHYRPKAGYRQSAREKLRKPGYYWLAYTWENLLLCCERCNRQYKKNLFPLLHPEYRARNHGHALETETPLLINPVEIDPQEHIGFRDEIPHAIEKSPHGKTTIAVLALDREDLNERRRDKLAWFKVLIDVVLSAQNQPHRQDLREIADEAESLLLRAIRPDAEYSAMVKSLSPIVTP